MSKGFPTLNADGARHTSITSGVVLVLDNVWQSFEEKYLILIVLVSLTEMAHVKLEDECSIWSISLYSMVDALRGTGIDE